MVLLIIIESSVSGGIVTAHGTIRKLKEFSADVREMSVASS